MAIYKDRKIQFAFIAGFLLLAIGFSLAFVQLRDFQNLLIIHFDSFSGIDVLGSAEQVYGILLSGLSLTIINFSLSFIFYNRERFFSYLIAYLNILAAFLIFSAVFAIIFVN